MRGALEYSTDLFDAATIARLAGHLQALLEAVVAPIPTGGCRELPLLTEAERHQVLVGVERHRGGLSRAARCVHQLFEAQAARTPTRWRVVYDGRGS